MRGIRTWWGRSGVVATLIAVALPLAASVGGAQTEPDRVKRTKDPIAGEYVVTVRPDAPGNPRALSRLIAKEFGGEVFYVYENALQGFAVRMSDADAQRLARSPFVEVVAENGVAQLEATQSGPTWGIDRIDEVSLPLDGQYVYGQTGAGVTAYIIDTGIRTSHTEFGGRASIGTDTVGDGQNGNDCNGHGTHVAGTVGGTTYGVAKQVTIKAVRVLNCSGSGSWAGVIAGVDWVTGDHQAGQPAVANMSLGGGAYSALDTAVANSIADGVTYAIAAGNSNANACNYSPARAPAALTVAATANTDARASFSNWGTCVDVFAPGVSITSAWKTDDTATNTISGTSMATPHVAGVAALYLGADPSASPGTIAARITADATAGVVVDPAGSPNLLLFTGTVPPPSTTTTATTTTTTTAPLARPGAPTIVSAVGGSQSVALGWSPPTTGGATTGYRVYRGTKSNRLTLVATLGTQTSWTNTGLDSARTYYYQITATNAAGESPQSNLVSARTL